MPGTCIVHWTKLSHVRLQVKLLKCLVEDVVVDISFETIGGLRAATFLTSLDLEISKRCRGDCLFIRSVILVGGLSEAATFGE